MKKIFLMNSKPVSVSAQANSENAAHHPFALTESATFNMKKTSDSLMKKRRLSTNGNLKIKIEKLVIKKKNQSTSGQKHLVIENNIHSRAKKPISYIRQNTEEISFPKIMNSPQIFQSDNFCNLSFGIKNDRNKDTEPDSNGKDNKLYFKLKTYTNNSNKVNELYRPQVNLDNEMYKLTIANIGLVFSDYSHVKTSFCSTGYIKAYAVNSYKGIVRSYNEDRVAIILTIAKPKGYNGIWPQCSLFAIYDGHGGNKCCDFLRDSLQDYIIKNNHFPFNPKAALISGIEKAEKDFVEKLALDSSGALIDKSGSCALVALIIDDICYVANVGDSRLIISKNKGRTTSTITTDHKPNEENETKRILSNGGKVYQSNSPQKKSGFVRKINIENKTPHRVIPGRLAVSRTIGDIEAKLPILGGNPNVVIATPDVTQFQIDKETDFFLMGCDGIFDSLSTEECVECAWKTLKSKKYGRTIHSKSGAVVDMIIKSSLKRRSFDNVTALFVAFDPFERSFEKKREERLHMSSNHYHHHHRKNKEEIIAIPSEPLCTNQDNQTKYKKSITLFL